MGGNRGRSHRSSFSGLGFHYDSGRGSWPGLGYCGNCSGEDVNCRGGAGLGVGKGDGGLNVTALDPRFSREHVFSGFGWSGLCRFQCHST